MPNTQLPFIALLTATAILACTQPSGAPPERQEQVNLDPRGEDVGVGSNSDSGGQQDAVTDDETPDPEPSMAPDPNPTMEPDPTDIYAHLEALEGSALVEGLADLVGDHRVFSYNDARDFMYGRRATIDVVDGLIECVYTGRTAVADGTRTPSDFNTEHSWPRNEGADVTPMLSDLHHLFPSTESSNQARGSIDFGETSCSGGACDFADGGSELGDRSGGGGQVFEVRLARRGDVARAHFYFSVRYGQPIGANEEAALRAWHAQDPPDARELTRNGDIERFQQNRNPFVDRPEFVARIDDF